MRESTLSKQRILKQSVC